MISKDFSEIIDISTAEKYDLFKSVELQAKSYNRFSVLPDTFHLDQKCFIILSDPFPQPLISIL